MLFSGAGTTHAASLSLSLHFDTSHGESLRQGRVLTDLSSSRAFPHSRRLSDADATPQNDSHPRAPPHFHALYHGSGIVTVLRRDVADISTEILA
jgi:hypothetical protein